MSRKVKTPSLEDVRRVVMQNLRDWNTPRSLSIFLILKNGCDSDLLSLRDFSPEDFNSPVAYAEFSYPTDLVRKGSGWLKLGIDTTAAAKSRFSEAEELCRKTNLRVRHCVSPKGRLGQNFDRLRKMIHDILPAWQLSDLDRLIEEGGWGGGVTSTAKRKLNNGFLSFRAKMETSQHCSTSLLPLAISLSKEVNGLSSQISIRDYNVVAFVPKNSKTDRAIAVEPSLNAYLQRGVGIRLRRVLKRLGVDLQHGQAHNQSLAQLGSKTGEYATIDLSMASDTLASKVVRVLFPQDWVTVMELMRSPCYLLDGKVSPYHKWSSMGNGYTFELESFLFACIIRCVVPKQYNWAVYGDDLIIPVQFVEEVAELLNYLGFVLNPSKTFSSGPFRESCGADFFDGVAVRGFYLKEINPVSFSVWYNWLRSDKVLSKAVRTMELLLTFANGCHSPIAISGAFNSGPFDSNELGLKRATHLGRRGWWFNIITFEGHSQPLNSSENIAAVAAYCRLALAREAVDRAPLVETKSKSGRWQRRRIFMDDMSLEISARG